ncbi:hypothetical protein SPRG_12789 [Saprolegnia parasitica CBS 223.65]|uniref:USP domain-containing protein n=1 Tax=Saprolegnia parasitica (strain CBS 223.65) TaxID=695850 RepID=A0A067BVN5_SAPPC|nr:hypothetical protein SPRG_12789 [Saprolegnia parasitica CBS 223.65]KDO22328.1 hypothetical protein SPRG_12789 [Saprolegnia parasitica CBS 223.65]|eukprot:XP_012206962.1 hypothetical protein SPRG_12789 [Saprolegnia parasitica CBS 223.65]
MTIDPCPDASSSSPARNAAGTGAPIMPTTTTPASKYRGLRNDSATCYLNSLLQTLYMTPELRTQLYQSTSSASEGSFLRELQLLFARLQLRTDRKAIDTTSLMQSFGWTSSDLLQQHDVHELYHVLFKALDASLQGSPNANVIHDLYQGTLTDSVQCITIPSTPTSLDDAIATFLAPERLVSDNQWLCDVCGTKQDAIKRLSLVQLPPLLTLHLKRFAWDHGTSKLTSRVSFPKYLDMNAYHPSTSSRPKVPPSSTSTQEAAAEATWHPSFDLAAMLACGPFVYELASVLVHAGSANGGHYVAYIQSSLDDDRRWLCFNDASVSTISEAKLRTTYGLTSVNGGYYESTRAPCAYVLQYRQVEVSRKVQCPPDDMIPSWLVDLVHAEMQCEQANKQARAKRRVAEETKKANVADMIQIKILHDNSHKMLHVSKTATLAEVTAQAVALFELRISLDRVRLRAYSEYLALPRETYDGREHCTLAALAIYAWSCLSLEVRASADEAWAVFDPTALQLLVRRYVPPTPSTPEHFTEPPELVQLPGNARLDDLVTLLSAKFNMNRDHLRLLEMRSTGYWAITTRILNPHHDEATLQQTLRTDLSLRDGSNIYVEAVDDLASSPSLAKELFEARANSITVQVQTNDPKLLRAKNIEGDAMGWPFTVDRRRPLQRSDTLTLRRGASKGAELKHLVASFLHLALMDQSTLWIELGVPLRAGQYRVQIHLYTPRPTDTTSPSKLVRHVWPLTHALSFCTTLVVSAEMLVSEIKARILAVLKHPRAKRLWLMDLSPNHRLQRVLSDDGTLGEASPLSLYENRSFAVQMLEPLEPRGAANMLVSIVLFDRAHLTFGREIAIAFSTLLPGTHWIDLLLLEIQTAFGLPPDAARLAKPSQTSAMDVIEMAHLSWLDRDQCLGWTNISSLVLFGDRLVLADARVPTKVLSTHELLDLQHRIDAVIDTYNNKSCVVVVGWSTKAVDRRVPWEQADRDRAHPW